MSRKWGNIRKYYTDELRRPADSPAKKKQRRRYHDLLTFLDDSVYKKRISRIDEFKNISREDVGNDSSTDSESNELYIVEDANELAKLSQNYATTDLPDINANTDPKLIENQEAIRAWQMWDGPLDLVKSNAENRPMNTLSPARTLSTVNSMPPVNSVPAVNSPPAINPLSPASSLSALNSMPAFNSLPDVNVTPITHAPVNTQAIRNPEILKLLNDEPRLPNPSNALSVIPISPGNRPAPDNILMSLNKTSSLDLNADACRSFLLALVPEIMSMNVKQNMQFRLGILDLLHEIKSRVNNNPN